jgi:hypothetical protein
MQYNHRQTQNKALNPKETFTPTLKPQLKLYKPNIPFRPVINNINAPTYKIAKQLVSILTF